MAFVFVRGAMNYKTLFKYGGYTYDKSLINARRNLSFHQRNTFFQYNKIQIQHTRYNSAKSGSGSGSKNSSRFLILRRNKYTKWLPIPLTICGGFLIYKAFVHSLDRAVENPEVVAKHWQVAWYRFLPLKTLSRLWGWIHDINLPEWSRKPALSVYVKTFKCVLEEAEEEDLKQYKNLGEFFRRGLKDGARSIDHNSALVSPSDGRILHFGEIKCGEIEQVKGVDYSIQGFLGPPTWLSVNVSDKDSNSKSRHRNPKCRDLDPTDPELMSNCDKYSAYISHNPKDTSNLYHIVIYLAPGDYHKFHSPADWTMSFRRHFAGDLLSVNPKIASFVRGLFNLNERAVYVGDWEHGFFAMVAVGATNVGSIKIYNDEELRTNVWKVKKGTIFDKSFSEPIHLKKGDPFGEFNLGSTLVLIFEGPPNYQFPFSPGDFIKVGQKIIQPAQQSSNEQQKANNNAKCKISK